MKINVVHLDRSTALQLHYFANFAEDVYREYQNNPRVEVDLGAVDRGSGVLVMSSRVGLKGRIEMRLDQLIKKHFLFGHVRIESIEK